MRKTEDKTDEERKKRKEYERTRKRRRRGAKKKKKEKEKKKKKRRTCCTSSISPSRSACFRCLRLAYSSRSLRPINAMPFFVVIFSRNEKEKEKGQRSKNIQQGARNALLFVVVVAKWVIIFCEIKREKQERAATIQRGRFGGVEAAQ